MTKFLKYIAFFLLPFIIGIVLLFFLSFDKKFAYEYVEGDCLGHGKWIYQRIFENSTPIDIAFLGSSKTMAGINELLIEDKIREKTGKKFHIANLGYCRLGRNLQYTIVKDLFKHKKPKYLILEVRSSESRRSHPMFGYLADNEDIRKPVLAFNKGVAENTLNAVTTRWAMTRQNLLHSFSDTIKTTFKNHSFARNKHIKNPEELKQWAAKAKKSTKQFKSLSNIPYTNTYFNKILKIATEHNTTVFFLYHPSFDMLKTQPQDYKVYKDLSDCWIPSDTIFKNSRNWMDQAHLNFFGAYSVSEAVVVELVKVIK